MYCCWPCSWLVSSGHVYVLTWVTTLSWIHQACNSHFFFNFTSSPFMPQSALVGAGASTDPIKVVFCSIGMFYPSPSFYPPLPWPTVMGCGEVFVMVLGWEHVPCVHRSSHRHLTVNTSYTALYVTYIRIIYSNSYLKCDFRRLNLLVVGYYKAYWNSHFTSLLFDWLFERMKIYIEDLSFVSKRHIFGPKNQPRRFFQNSELNAAGIYKSYTIFCNPMIFCGSIQILHRKIYIGVEKLAWKWSQFLLKLQRNLQI